MKPTSEDALLLRFRPKEREPHAFRLGNIGDPRPEIEFFLFLLDLHADDRVALELGLEVST